MPPTQHFSFPALSPDSDSDVASTPSLLSASSVVPSPDSQLLNSFDPVAALSGNPALLASLMSAIANMTPEQQEQMFSSVYGAAVDHASASASASPPAESAFIQFNTQNTAFAEGAGALPNWLEMSLLSGNSPSQSHSSVEPSPQSAPISATDALISMLLTQNTQTTAFPTFTQQPVATSTVDPLSALLASASALPPPPASLPPPPTASIPPPPATSTTSSRPVPEIAALISQVYGDRSAPAIQNIPNILEIVQSALSKKDVAETSSGKESRQRKHDEMEHDGSGSDSGVAASSKSTKRRKALTEEEKEEKQRERMLRNRAAAQESRDKKKRYVENLESMTEELKSQNTLLQARLRHSESQNRLLESRLEALATHFVAHMTARTNSNLPISPPISSHSPIDVPHTDSAAVDPQSARVSATTQPRPPSVSPNMDAGTDGVGSVASKHPYAFGDADSFVIPSFVESRGVSARKSSTLQSTLTSPQRTLWTSSWSTSSTPSAVSLASKPISRRFSEVVVKEEDVGVPSVSPDNTRDLAVVSATIVHGVLLWMVDVTAGGVAGRWRGRPGAGSGARWGYTGTPGGGGVQPLLRRKSWGAGLRMGGGVERKALWLNSGSTTASASA